MKIRYKITNPIYFELKKLNLIEDSKLFTLNKKTRDAKICVIKDLKSKIIFLEKNIYRQKNFYTTMKYKNNWDIKTLSGNIKTPEIPDDHRRAVQFKKYFKNKSILDFGCGWGGFLKNLKYYKSLNGIEIRKECLNYIQKKIKKIKISNDINSIKNKFDVITMFHVLEHIPNQIETLKILKSKLNNKGKIIIEVPHAEDFLILQDELKEFRDFIFWSEHLVLHTYKSLKTVLSKSGFKKINIYYYQRHGFSNHLGWFLKRKPGGQNFYEKIISDKLDNFYIENLKKLGQTDTLVAIAE